MIARTLPFPLVRRGLLVVVLAALAAPAAAASDQAWVLAEADGLPLARIEPLALRFEAVPEALADAAADAAGSPAAPAAPPLPLFLAPPSAFPLAALPAAASPAAVEAHTVRVSRQAVGAGVERLLVELPGGDRLVAARTAATAHGGDRVTWTGRLEGSGGRVILARVGAAVAGLLYAPDAVYELVPTAGGTVLARLDQELYPECAGGVAPTHSAAAFEAPAFEVAAADDPPSQIDVLALYTAQARDAAGGTANVVATIQAAVAAANVAFEDSGMAARLRLVHTTLVGHPDSGSTSFDLQWVSTDAGVAALRDEHAADLVGLIVENGGAACGQAFVMRSPGPGFAANAFQVTARGCAVGNLTYAHEHGHNLGFEHDPSNGAPSASASFPYAFGHFVDGSYRTVMSYSGGCSAGCPRVAHFSNPDVLHAGAPTGVADQRDNRRAGEETAPIAANFRQSVPATSFSVWNEGTSPLEVAAIDPEAAAPWLSWQPDAPFTVQPGGSLVVAVAADLLAAPPGEVTVRLVVHSNDANRSPYPGGVFVTTVTPGGACAPLTVPPHAVAGTELYEACSTLAAGAGVTVPAGARLVLRSASRVVLGDGFAVESGGELELGLDASLHGP